jgi:hypothetical protein
MVPHPRRHLTNRGAGIGVPQFNRGVVGGGCYFGNGSRHPLHQPPGKRDRRGGLGGWGLLLEHGKSKAALLGREHGSTSAIAPHRKKGRSMVVEEQSQEAGVVQADRMAT